MPLVTFRVVFGILMFYASLRYAYYGWIDTLYLDPDFYFPFVQGIAPIGSTGIYTLFMIMVLSTLGIMLGLFFRVSTVLFFLIFTYFELLDKTFYLNHYYLVCLLSFLLCFTSANRYFSLDVYFRPKLKRLTCPAWQIQIFKLQLSIVYFFAGLAKVNSDWLFHAQPMATWLPGRYSLPIIGRWLHLSWLAFLFSWLGCLYDLTIWIFLWIKKTRSLAYIAVIIFHVLTYILFPRIGMFPYIMMTSTLIFFSASWHEKLIGALKKWGGRNMVFKEQKNVGFTQPAGTGKTVAELFLIGYLLIQLYLPLRYLQYGGHLFWHERGYRFSWRVMLMEKSGLTHIVVRDPKTQLQYEVDQDQYLTRFQQKEMSTQPDMILQFVHHVGDEFKNQKHYEPEVYVYSRVSLNGRRSKPFTDPEINAYLLDDPFRNKNWILSFDQ